LRGRHGIFQIACQLNHSKTMEVYAPIRSDVTLTISWICHQYTPLHFTS
jgi:hypothetical protein